MDSCLTFLYFREDILHVDIDVGGTYLGQESNHLKGDEEIVARFNPVTGAVENLEIIFFTAWILKEGYIDMYLTPYYGNLKWGEWTPEDGRLTLRYDKSADTLTVEIDGARAYPAQKRRRIGDGDVLIRFNPDTGKAESFDIPFFYERMKSQEPLRVSLTPYAEIAAAQAVG